MSNGPRFSPDALGTALARRMAAMSPRAFGGFLAALGLGCATLEAMVRSSVGRSYPFLVLAAGPLIPVGVFSLLTNRRWDEEAPLWWKIVCSVLTAAGLAAAGFVLLSNR